MDAGLVEIFRRAGFEWEAIGRARREIPCISSFAPGIEFLIRDQNMFDSAASKSLTSRAVSGMPSAWTQKVSF